MRSSSLLAASMLCAVALSHDSASATRVTGDYIEINYNGNVQWNNDSTRTGFRIRSGPSDTVWRDVTYPGSPWVYMTLRYQIGSTTHYYYAGGSSYGTNFPAPTVTYYSSGATRGSAAVFTTPHLRIERDEIYLANARSIDTKHRFTNISGSTITNIRFVHAHDPDQDSGSWVSSPTAVTVNDTVDSDGDTKPDYTESVGNSSSWTVGYGVCNQNNEIGHNNWNQDPDAVFYDENRRANDWTMHWRHTEATLAAGDTAIMGYIFVFGRNRSESYSQYLGDRPLYCEECDGDGDGHFKIACGGDDCDDEDPSVCPSCPEICDEKDNDCDGRIDVDAVDADTFYRDADGDTFGDPRVSIRVCELPAGYVTNPDDCDDSDASIYPGATEIPYDGIDQDCSGSDLCDVDGDGHDASIGACFGLDCDDGDYDIRPGAKETWYDGVDQNCDGWSDFDADMDGFDSAAFGGEDCDDADPAIRPGAIEIWYDGIDQDCDGRSDWDQDRDGHDSAWHKKPDGSVGLDCDDRDDTVYPGAPSLPDGKDNSCDGKTELTDSDGDGIPDYDELRIGTDPYNPDTDGDGLSDGYEVGDLSNPRDSDGDGVIDALDDDDDGDGIPTAVEIGPDRTSPVDTDGDGTPDYLDLDSDGDGWLDAVEGNVDSDGDGVADYLDLDSDDDGVPDAEELDADTDADGLTNRVDPDDDGDGFSTLEERGWDPRDFDAKIDYYSSIQGFDPRDVDGDGTPNHLDEDSDGDGRLDIDEGMGDDDCDGLPNVLDPDDADGPCLGGAPVAAYQSGACAGASSVAGPVGLGGLAFGLLALAGLRRRR
jgi:hypothetical protein